MLVCVCIFSSCQSLFLSILFCFDAMKMSKYSLIYVQSFCLSWSFFAYVVYFLCGPIFQLCGLFAMWSICDFLIFLASIFNFIYNFCYVICEFVLCVTSVLCNSSFNMVISSVDIGRHTRYFLFYEYGSSVVSVVVTRLVVSYVICVSL